MSELQAQTRIIDTTDKTARRTFGLEKPEAQPSFHLGVIMQSTEFHQTQNIDMAQEPQGQADLDNPTAL